MWLPISCETLGDQTCSNLGGQDLAPWAIRGLATSRFPNGTMRMVAANDESPGYRTKFSTIVAPD
jgi:hypothetical protein